MRIISIDPGYERLGIAILEKQQGGKETYLFSTCIKTSKSLAHSERLKILVEETSKIIKTWQPEVLAIEKLFLANNQKTAMNVAEARGVVLSECARNGLKVFEYSPPQIKLAVAGHGNADKKSIIKMIPLLIKVPSAVTIDDEFDAIAIGLTFFAIEKVF